MNKVKTYLGILPNTTEMKVAALKTDRLEAFHSEALVTERYSLLTNIGRKGNFMHSWVQVDHIRWRALAVQVSCEPLRRHRVQDGVRREDMIRGHRTFFSISYIHLPH